MNKSCLMSIFGFLLVTTALYAHKSNAYGIRLYQESDRTILNSMLEGNKDLLLPGDNLKDQLLKTIKYVESKNYTTKVFVKAGIPVGFITYQKELSLPWFLRLILGSTGSIQLFNVVEEYRRQGIGAALLNDALAAMKKSGFDTVIVKTKVANTAARAIYEKYGFTLYFQIASKASDCFYTCKLVNLKL